MNLERDFWEIAGFCFRAGTVALCYYLAKQHITSKPEESWPIRTAQCLIAAAVFAALLSLGGGDGCESDDGDCHRDAAEQDAKLTEHERAAIERRREHEFEINLILFLAAAGFGCVDGRNKNKKGSTG